MQLFSRYHARGYLKLLPFDSTHDAYCVEQLIHRGVSLWQCIGNMFLPWYPLENGDCFCLERVTQPGYSGTKSVVFPFIDSVVGEIGGSAPRGSPRTVGRVARQGSNGRSLRIEEGTSNEQQTTQPDSLSNRKRTTTSD